MAEFKLGRLRFVWQGAWTTGTAYVKDDIIRNGGKTFVCVVGHTASALFTTDLNAQPTKWNQVSDGSSWTGNWTTSTQYNLNDLAKYGGIVYICNTSHISNASTSSNTSPDTTAGLEADQLKWTAYATSFNWLGNWSNTYRYKANDVIKYGAETYVCNTGHTSTSATLALNISSASSSGGTATLTFASAQSALPYSVGTGITVSGFTNATQFNGSFTITAVSTTTVSYLLNGTYTDTTGSVSGTSLQGLELDQSKWTVFSDGLSWRTAWTISTHYKVNDVVTYGGYVYVCNTAHNSSSTAALGLENDQSKWDYLHKGFNYLGAWSGSSIRYRINDIVVYGGDTYICTTAHTSTTTFATNSWSRFVEGLTYFNTWNSSTTYGVGDVVTYGGFAYIAGSVNSNTTPSTDAANPTTLNIQSATSTASVVTLNFTTGGTQFQSGQTITVSGVTPSSYNGQYVVIGTPSATQVQYLINNGPYSTGSGGTASVVNWMLFTTGFKLVGDWATGQSYQVGNVVRNGGYTYLALLDNTSSSGNQPPNNTYWSRLNSGIRWNAPGLSYTALSPTNVTVTNGSAAGAVFSVATTGTVYSVTKTSNGSNYTTNDVIKILGTQVGGISPFNDITITVGTVTSGSITTFTSSGYATTWATGTLYVAGDIAVYGPNSYICILAHTAGFTSTTGPATGTNNRPDTDTTAIYWNTIAAGASTSILTTQGDIAYFGPTGATRLGIGSPGQVLKVSNSGIPSWGYFGLVNNVYYVSNTNGIDSPAPGYGTTLDRPWKTIAYAAKQVFNGTQNPNAAYLLNQNKNWAVAEMYNWMINQKTTSTAPFSTTSVYDQYKTQRDAGLIVDGFVYDITRGGNSQTVAAALAFFQQGSTTTFYNTNVAAQVAFYIAALTKLSSLLTTNVLANTAPGTIYQNTTGGSGTVTSLAITGASGQNGEVTYTFANQANSPFVIGENITVSGVSPSGYNGTYKVVQLSQTSVTVSSVTTATYSSGGTIAGVVISQTIDSNFPAETGASATVTALMGIITTALTNTSTATIPPSNTGVTSTIFIKNGTYNEVLPITVPENCALVGDELRGVIVQPLATTGSTSNGSIVNTLLTVGNITNILTSQSITSTSVGTYGSTSTGGLVTVASTAGLNTGHVFNVTGSGGGGITAGIYYVGQVVSATTLTLASTYANALSGTYLSLTASSPSATTFSAHGQFIVGSFVSGTAIAAPVRITAQLTGASGSSVTSQTFNGSSGSFNITLSSSNSAVLIGQFVSGDGAAISGIPANTFVTAVNGATITLSNELTSTFTGNTTTAYFFTAGKTGTYTINSTIPSMLSLNVSSQTFTAGYVTGDMFYCRNGSGVRNMTLFGLTGSVGTPLTIASGNVTASAPGIYGTATGSTGGSITITSTLGLNTGNIFTVSGSGGGGLTAGTYYVGQVLTTTTLTLSSTYNNAVAGTYLAFSSATITTTTYAASYGTSRPTAGAYASLDPGAGPADSTAWIIRKSPYIQNVTTFGTGCVGLKIDGTLHQGGNHSIVCNDFTQVLSDGIGVWCTGPGSLTECVSVFSYYNQIGYLAEAGGRIRATNGNSSYGSFGVAAEGYDGTEVPLTAQVNNRYGSPVIANVVTDALNKIYRVEFTNAGNAANSATFAFASSNGYGVTTVANEFRDNAVFETRWLTGGLNYMTASNVGQGGTSTNIQIAATDLNVSSAYLGLRLFITGGTGAGQYGFIANYNNGTKTALMAKESFGQQTITATTNASASNTAAIINPNTTGAGGGYMTATGTATGSFATGMILTSAGTITAGTYITSVNTGTIGAASLASTILSTTGTIGSITGTGPWTATITGMSSTTGFIVGMPLTATSGAGTLYGGSPTSVVVASIVSSTSITYTVTGGTTPTSGAITNISSTLLSAGTASTGITQYGFLSGGSVTSGTYTVGQVTATGATAIATATFTGSSASTILTLTSFSVGSIFAVQIGQFIAPISGIPANTYVTGVNINAGTITISNTTVGAVSGSTSVYTAGGLGTYGLNQAATGTPTTSISYSVSASQTRASAAVAGTQNTLTVSTTVDIYNGMPIYFSATTGTNLTAATLYYAMAVVPNSTVFSVGTASNSTSAQVVATLTGQSSLLYAAGFDHALAGTPIVGTSGALAATLDTTSTYIIEPRCILTSPAFTPTTGTQNSAAWIDCAYGDINATYSNVSATGGSGASASFTVARTGTVYVVTIGVGGTNYVIGDTLTVAGTSLGGTSTNNITISVTNVSGTTGAVTNFTFTGQGQGGNYVAVATGVTTSQYSTNGTSWTSGGALPSAANWTSIAAGAISGTTTWVAVANGSNTSAVSTNGGVTWSAGGSLGTTSNWSNVAYGNGYFAAVQYGGTSIVYSNNPAISWSSSSGGLPTTSNWTSVAYGNGVWVAIASGTTASALSSSANASVWTASNGLPSAANWTSVTFGKGKFVAVASGSTTTAYSFDGNTWYASTFGLPSIQRWSKVRYGQGLFFVTTSDTTTTAATSEDGLLWTSQTLNTSTGGNNVLAFGNTNSTPLWVTLPYNSSAFNSIVAGCTAQARAAVASTTITSFRMWEPGSSYASTPTMTIIDPNQTNTATWSVRTGAGALANPTYTSRGSAYATASASVTTNGYTDIYQPSTIINVSGLTTQPTAGSNVLFANNSTVYKLVQVNNFVGTGGGQSPYIASFQINPSLTTSNAPVNGAAITIRLKYSQVRLTGHDFLSIGTGNFSNTNYPGVPYIAANSNYQTVSNNGGRVFFTSTDQDGNFNVGNLFSVQQATGVTTLNASAFNVAGLNSLTIGSVSLGTNSATVTSFSTDPYFTANSDNILPTQKAIKTYITSQIGGGGSTLVVNTLTAGIIYVSGNTISTTSGGQIKVANKMYFVGGIDGYPLAWNFLLN